MCKLKSCIVLKDRIFMPDYDGHSQMLEELGITDDYLGASKKFVRVEFSPVNGDVFSDIDGWELTVDQDVKPDWFSAEEYKPKIVEAVKEWARSHIHIGVDNLKISAGEAHYIKDCKNVEIYGNATVNKVCENATVNEVYGNATVKWVCGNATIKWVYGNATVNEVCGNATVKWVYGNATVNKVYENATVNEVYENATVNEVCGNATVTEVCENATVNEVCGNATVNEVCGNATVTSSSYNKWNNADSLILSDNSTFKDNYGKVIYQSGSYKLISVESGKKLSEREDI